MNKKTEVHVGNMMDTNLIQKMALIEICAKKGLDPVKMFDKTSKTPNTEEGTLPSEEPYDFEKLERIHNLKKGDIEEAKVVDNEKE